MAKEKTITDALPVGTVLTGKAYRYTIEKVLDRGAFGITYKASVRMEGSLGTLDTGFTVAIKEFFMEKINGREKTVVTGSRQDGTFAYYKEKFIKEAISLGRLDHPNIVKVVEQFEANNTAYYVMEFIAGGSLDKKIADVGKLSEAQIVNYIWQIGAALQFMHARHILHLDLKPKNVMLTTDDKVKLIDFGLTKQFDDDGKPETSTTIGNGTPGYAPLEQADYKGDSPEFPATMDIYALGATIFKMATGHRPPDASTVLNAGFPADELIGVSGKLKVVIKRAISPMTRNRYQTISQLLSDLPSVSGASDKLEIDVIGFDNPSKKESKSTDKSHEVDKESSQTKFENSEVKSLGEPAEIAQLRELVESGSRVLRYERMGYLNNIIKGTKNQVTPLAMSFIEENVRKAEQIILIGEKIGGKTAYARWQLGKLYLCGSGSVNRNRTKGLSILSDKNQKDGDNFYHLGLMSEYGVHLEQNAQNAKAYYELAIERGHQEAMFRLGLAYLEGCNLVEIDYTKAFNLFKRSNLQSSRNNLGYMYYLGLGTKVDKAKAKRIWEKNALGKLGDDVAAHNLDYAHDFVLFRAFRRLKIDHGDISDDLRYIR